MACWGTVGLESQVEEMNSAQCGRIFGRRRLRVKLNTLSGIVSVKEVLFKRKVAVEPLCPVCWEEPESLLHLFSRCKFAQSVWKFYPLGLDSVSVGGEDFRDWFTTLLARWKVNLACKDSNDFLEAQKSLAQVVAERGPNPPTARCLALSGITTTLVAEALAAREGLVLASTVTRVQISALLSPIFGGVLGRCTSGVNSDLVAWLHFGGYDSVLFTPFDVVSAWSGLPLVPSFHLQPSR
ncbi:hypothetical protein C3L33_22120, partial [Rhododendron williamsianum]